MTTKTILSPIKDALVETFSMPLIWVILALVVGITIGGLTDTYDVKSRYCSNIPYGIRKVNKDWKCQR
jgi:flagellar biosynthesis protein FliQ